MKPVAAICILLAAMVWIVFGQTLGHEFVNYDDNAYVYENPAVIHGLTLHGIAWAFTHAQVEHWIPLTTISHMLDCQLYGLQPGGHHLTNVLLHMASAILLFLVLKEMTGALWRSAFVAAVFAVHPLHVESVAWVSERKDVLSGVFFMLTIAAYVRYTRKPRSPARYVTALLLFALGLMSKDMLVTLPFVLLLLDYWPLGRFGQPAHAEVGTGVPMPLERFSVPLRLILEKAPFFALSAAACVIQMLVIESVASIEKMPLFTRTSNALVSYVIYLKQMVYPAGLAATYADPGNLPAWEVILSLVVLASICAGAFAWRRSHPFLLVGWLWYLGMLVPPVIGFVRIGHAQSDRYTYLPQIGLYIAIVWMCADLCKAVHWRRMLVAAGLMAVAALMVCACVQASYWKNSQTLWNHALAVTTDNAVAQYCLAGVLVDHGQVDEAISHYQKALEINPDYAQACYDFASVLQKKGNVDEAIAYYQKALEIAPNMLDARLNLGIAFRQRGMTNEALEQFQKALAINPDSPKVHDNIGLTLLQNGQVDDAIAQYQRALEIDPRFAEAHSDLGASLLQKGQVDDAIAQYQKALEIDPDFAEAHYNLGVALQQKGQLADAIAQYQKSIVIKPDLAPALNNLAYLLAVCPQASLRNGARAVTLAKQANQATGGSDPMMLGTLAAAYAEAGQFSEAVETAQRALDLANSQSKATLSDLLRSQVALYQARTPLRDASLGK